MCHSMLLSLHMPQAFLFDAYYWIGLFTHNNLSLPFTKAFTLCPSSIPNLHRMEISETTPHIATPIWEQASSDLLNHSYCDSKALGLIYNTIFSSTIIPPITSTMNFSPNPYSLFPSLNGIPLPLVISEGWLGIPMGWWLIFWSMWQIKRRIRFDPLHLSLWFCWMKDWKLTRPCPIGL